MRGLRGRRCGLVRQSAVDQVEDAIGVGHQPGVVADQEQDGAAVVGGRVQQPDDLLAVAPVERAGRLVGEAEPRALEQGTPHGHALLLAAGELVGADVAAAAQAELVEHLGDAAAGLAARGALAPADDHLQLLAGRQRGEQVEALEDEAEVPQPEPLAGRFAHPPEVLPQDRHLAPIGPQQPREHGQQGGLAAAGGAHQQQHLARVQLQGDVAEHAHGRLAGAEGAVQVAGDQGRLGWHRRGRPSSQAG